MRLTSTMRCTPLIFFLPTVLNLTWLWTTSWLKLMVTSLRVGESGDQFFTSCTRDVIGESGVPLCVARVSLLPFAFYQYVETKISGRRGWHYGSVTCSRTVGRPQNFVGQFSLSHSGHQKATLPTLRPTVGHDQTQLDCNSLAATVVVVLYFGAPDNQMHPLRHFIV